MDRRESFTRKKCGTLGWIYGGFWGFGKGAAGKSSWPKFFWTRAALGFSLCDGAPKKLQSELQTGVWRLWGGRECRVSRMSDAFTVFRH